MKKYCAVDIQDDFAIVLNLQKNGDFFTIKDSSIIIKDQLALYTKNEKNIYLSIEQEEDIDEKISIDSIIKNKDAIKGSIKLKLSEYTSDKEIIFNNYEISDNQDSDFSVYKVDGVYKEEYLKELGYIDDIANIKNATISKFSLAAISNMCLDTQTYFSVYTTTNKVITIAVNNGEIIYSRFNKIVANNAEVRVINIVAEINQTINYVRQQFREIDFSTIVFSGNIAIDDTISEHLYLSIANMNMAVLYPNSFINGIENEEAQPYMLALGSLFVPKKFQFIPEFVKGARQYGVALKSLAASSFIMLIVSSFIAYGSYYEYAGEYAEYETTKIRLELKAKSLMTYTQEELDNSLVYVKNQQLSYSHHPIDIFLLLKPVFELQKPETMEWKYIKESIETRFTFKKHFKTLEALYRFEDSFYRNLGGIKSPLIKEYTKTSDYSKLLFASTITISDKKSKGPLAAPVKRRR